MTAQEFFEQNKGKYFNYLGEKVRVIGYGNESDITIIISRNNGWNYNGDFLYIEEICPELIETNKKCWFIDIHSLTPIEQPELDLCKLLEGCEGMTFYSTMVGYCKLIDVVESIMIGYGDDDDYVVLESDGKYSIEGECTLFPSKENRDWSTFVRPNKIKDGTPVMCKMIGTYGWFLRKFDETIITNYKWIVPVSEFDFNDFDSNKSKSII